MSKGAPKSGDKSKTAKPVPAGPGTDEEQDRVLEEAKKNVGLQAFYMKRCLDSGKLMDALKHASNMVCELRTSLLSPKKYYELYIDTSDQLRYLEAYLHEEKQRGKRLSELYELVQYAGNILPRLYLLITVGSVYIKNQEALAKDVLRDLVEMCRGVQHPTRGLFLRTYLMEMTKDKLPDRGTEGPGGSVHDSIEFVLQNFTEMNKLWVRMAHQGAHDKEKREQERQELRTLIGKNLSRLSQLDGVDIEIYTKTVLPSVVEQIINCKDQMAQQYLMECLIQAFPDDYHLASLDVLLSTCAQLHHGVDIRAIVSSLVERLAAYSASSGRGLPPDIKVFEVVFAYSSKIVEQRSKMPLEDILALEVALLQLCHRCYPSNLAYVDQVLGFAADTIERLQKKDADVLKGNNAPKQVLKLLGTPLDFYKNILTLLQLQHYPRLVHFLAYNHRKRVAIDVVRNAIEHSTYIADAEQVHNLFENYIQPLLRDQPDQPEAVDKEDWEEEQNLVARLVHLFGLARGGYGGFGPGASTAYAYAHAHGAATEPDQLFSMYVTARKHFGQGGTRIRRTLAPLVFRTLQLAAQLKVLLADRPDEWSLSGRKLFKFAHETVTALARASQAELALRLFLQCAQSASHCGFETIAYEFLTQAFTLYEEDISDNKAQLRAMTLVIGTVQTLKVFGEENYDAIVTKTAMHSAKLLKKPDQCRAVYLCAHLFWTEHHRDAKRVLECLQKSLRIADACMDASVNVQLFVEILNEYRYFYERNEQVTTKYIHSLVDLINANIAELMKLASPESAEINTFYQNTLRFIRKEQDTPTSGWYELRGAKE